MGLRRFFEAIIGAPSKPGPPAQPPTLPTPPARRNEIPTVGPPVCPNCSADLPWMPKRKRRCPSCRKDIYVKWRPTERIKRLVTGEQALRIDAEWEERHRRVDIGPNPSARRVRGLLASAGGPSFTQALCIHEEGRDSSSVMREFWVRKLESYRESGVNQVEICSSGGCDHCEELDGKRFSVAAALKAMPLPCPGCEWNQNAAGRGWCRCSYIPHFPGEREDAGLTSTGKVISIRKVDG